MCLIALSVHRLLWHLHRLYMEFMCLNSENCAPQTSQFSCVNFTNNIKSLERQDKTKRLQNTSTKEHV